MRRATFLMAIGIVCALIALAVAQVPQPQRGMVVMWLLIVGPAAFVVLKLAGAWHTYSMKQLDVQAKTQAAPARAGGRTTTKRAERAPGLRVVRGQARRGRETV